MNAQDFRIAMTDQQRAEHRPGRGIETNGVGKRTIAHLNLTRSQADVYDIRKEWNGHSNWWRWTPRP